MMTEKFILMSLEEGKAKKLAKVINSDASRKILDFLSERNATESEIAKSLNIPLSTVHYNIKILEEAGLIEVNEYHYSEKMKEVNHYSLANKYVVIAPKKDVLGLNDKLKSILPSIGIVGGIALVYHYFVKISQTRLAESTAIAQAKTALPSSAESLREVALTESTQAAFTVQPTSIKPWPMQISWLDWLLLIVIISITVFAVYLFIDWLRHKKR